MSIQLTVTAADSFIGPLDSINAYRLAVNLADRAIQNSAILVI